MQPLGCMWLVPKAFEWEKCGNAECQYHDNSLNTSGEIEKAAYLQADLTVAYYCTSVQHSSFVKGDDS